MGPLITFCIPSNCPLPFLFSHSPLDGVGDIFLSTAPSPMAPVSESLAYANATGNTKSFITPAAVFAFLFEVLLVILIILSIFAIVRRYFMARSPQTSAQTCPSLSADAEAQQGASPSFVKTRGWRSWDASRTSSAVAAFRYHRGALDDTATLLEKGPEAALPPASFPVSTRAESSQRSASLSDNAHGRLHSHVLATNQSEPRRVGTSSLSGILHSCTSTTPNYSSTGDSRSSTWFPPHIRVGDRPAQDHVPPSSGLARRPPNADMVPSIVVTTSKDDFEVSSPASTYSEPDSPTVSTPPLEFSADIHVYDNSLGGLSTPPWTWAPAVGDDGHTVDSDILDGMSQPADYFGGKAACASQDFATRGVLCEGADPRSLEQMTISENERPATQTIIAAPKLDATPILQFWLNGPALVTQCWAEDDAHLASGTGSEREDEEEWEAAWRTGGRLIRAFASSCSTESVDGIEQDEGEATDYHIEIHNVKAQRFVSDSQPCYSKLDIIDPHCEVPVEWCGRPESAGSSSSWQSSDTGGSRRVSRSESGSSFYSCSGSSYTEEFEASDSFSDKVDCSSLRFDISATYGQPPPTICTT
ncbi:hypothetical protein GY45DRAFT_1360977 [Cubamyces sp. BRFM 1775]|nr:hypothetical protein GY45DRAFT_1360977 [Cubamyces sp. BRFM 1775]